MDQAELITEAAALVGRLRDAYRNEKNAARSQRILRLFTQAQWRVARRDWKCQIGAL